MKDSTPWALIGVGIALFLFLLVVLISALVISHHSKQQKQAFIDREQLSAFLLSGPRKQLRLDEKQLGEWKVPPRLLKMRPGEELARALRQEFAQLVEKGFQDRLEAEHRVDKGERVWLSHFESKGQLKHWALIIHDQKYELRRNRPQNKEGNSPSAEHADSWISIRSVLGRHLKGYEYRIKPSTIDEEKRRLAVSDQRQPTIEGLYFSMVGWTSKTKEEVDEICRNTMEGFGGYNLIFNNCHHFLRSFANSVVTEKGPDWAWFVESTLSGYQYKPLTNPVALAVLTRLWQEKLREMVEIIGDGQSIIVEWRISECGKHIKTKEDRYVCGVITTLLLMPGDYGSGAADWSNDPPHHGSRGDSGGAGCSHSGGGDAGGDAGDGGGGGA